MNYPEFVASTISKDFHTEIIPPIQIGMALAMATALGNLTDDTKRGLFYGKRKPETQGPAMEIMQTAGMMVGNLDAVPPFPEEHKDLLHAFLGLSSELGEMAEAILIMMTGKPLDTVNMTEELGDLRWYLQAAYNYLHTDDQGVVQTNINKLSKRYPDLVFSMERAENRDLAAERESLEQDATLYGSNVLPSTVGVNDKEYQLGDLVRRAFDKTGMTVRQWNNMPDDYREVLLCRELQNWRIETFGVPSSH